MTDLTEQWKKGELESGWYWVKGSRAEGIYAYTAEYLNTMYRPQNSERIIEQVPSYEEWKEKLEENTKTKELLKECREVMSTGGYIFATVKQVKRARKLLENIDQALGEE